MKQMEKAMPRGSYPSINKDDIENFTVNLPSLKEQIKFERKYYKNLLEDFGNIILTTYRKFLKYFPFNQNSLRFLNVSITYLIYIKYKLSIIAPSVDNLHTN